MVGNAGCTRSLRSNRSSTPATEPTMPRSVHVNAIRTRKRQSSTCVFLAIAERACGDARTDRGEHNSVDCIGCLALAVAAPLATRTDRTTNAVNAERNGGMVAVGLNGAQDTARSHLSTSAEGAAQKRFGLRFEFAPKRPRANVAGLDGLRMCGGDHCTCTSLLLLENNTAHMNQHRPTLTHGCRSPNDTHGNGIVVSWGRRE